MIEYALYVAYFALALTLPIVKRVNKNHATHGMVFAQLPYDAVTEAVGQSPEGRRVQEIGETRFQNLIGWAISAALAAAFSFPYDFITLPLAGVLATALTYRLRFFDMLGHTAEVLVAERENRPKYRYNEIGRMLGSTRHMHKTRTQIGREMDRWAWLARVHIALAR